MSPSLLATVGARARFNTFAFNSDSQLVRNQSFIRFAGEGTKAGIRGVNLLRGKEHVDTTLLIEHAAGHCDSREQFKTVLDDQSHGVFQGKIVVEPHAQKTNAKMMTRALLLSDEAEADNKPELEIFADDVVCGHGATAGALDPGLEILSDVARHPREGSRSAADPGLHRRDRRGDRARRHPRRADVCRHKMAGGARMSMHPAVSNGSYDVAKIRADFPALAMQVYGKPLVYLDNAASAQKPQAVLDRIQKAYTAEYANVHRGLHYLANEATEAYEGAREKVRAFLNARRARKRSSSPATPPRRSIWWRRASAARASRPGDEIVLSIMEHHSNIVPWHFLRERQGAVIKWAPVDDEGNFLIDEFEKLLSPRTKMVAITQMSNALGTVVPVKEVIKLAHARGIPVLVDGAQGAVHLDVDVQDLDCDFYVMTGHKLYGPTGIGVLYGKYDLLAAMPPFNGGGEMIREVYEDRITYGEPPHRFEAGTPPIVQAIGLGAALDYIQSVGKARIRAHEAALVKYAHERLGAINSLRIIGTGARTRGRSSRSRSRARIRTTSRPSSTAPASRCAPAPIASCRCWRALASPPPAAPRLRMYNTKDEVDILAASLVKAQEFFA